MQLVAIPFKHADKPILDQDDRNILIPIRGFSLVSYEQLEYLSKFIGSRKLVEVFSGVGYVSYWLNQLKQPGAVIDAFDDRSWFIGEYWLSDEYQRKAYYGEQQSAETIEYENYDIVMMMYPNLDDPISEFVLQRMTTGQTLIYYGEWQGGNCACDEMFNYLHDNFTIIDTQELDKHQIQYVFYNTDSKYTSDQFTIAIKR